jgi:hypothetical protein
MSPTGLYKTPCTCVSEIDYNSRGKSFQSRSKSVRHKPERTGINSSKDQMAKWFLSPLFSELNQKETPSKEHATNSFGYIHHEIPCS